MSDDQPTRGDPWRVVALVLALLMLGAGGVFAWRWLRSQTPGPDRVVLSVSPEIAGGGNVRGRGPASPRPAALPPAKGQIIPAYDFYAARVKVDGCDLVIRHFATDASPQYEYQIAVYQGWPVDEIRLLVAANTAVTTPNIEITPELRQQLREALEPEFIRRIRPVADVDKSVQSLWQDYSAAKGEAAQAAAADKLYDAVLAWRDKWRESHKATAAAVAAELRQLITPEVQAEIDNPKEMPVTRPAMRFTTSPASRATTSSIDVPAATRPASRPSTMAASTRP